MGLGGALSLGLQELQGHIGGGPPGLLGQRCPACPSSVLVPVGGAVRRQQGCQVGWGQEKGFRFPGQ